MSDSALCPPADIMRRLRERTMEIHAATEELPLMRALLAPGVETVHYRRYLAALHGVYLAVEPALYAAVSPAVLTRLCVRPKLPALQRDLAALGAAAALPAP
ncbi:MAG: biliverdin-producing heme oxygenase, partial [Thiohalocapsa sp.]